MSQRVVDDDQATDTLRDRVLFLPPDWRTGGICGRLGALDYALAVARRESVPERKVSATVNRGRR